MSNLPSGRPAPVELHPFPFEGGCFREYAAVQKALAHRPNGTLYHYTDARGFIGILQPEGPEPPIRTIWASDLRFLNDARELSLGRELIREKLNGRLHEIPKPEVRRAVGASVNAEAPYINFFSPFAVSFSECGDSLSQWRAYCPRGGYAIGFPCVGPNTLPRIAERNAADKGGWRWGHVVYDAHLYNPLVEELVEEAIKRLYGGAGEFDVEIGALLIAVLRLSSVIKDAAFADEKEWRLMPPLDPLAPKVQFRRSSFGVTPYVELQIDVDGDVIPELKVMVGPSPHQQLAAAAAVDLLSVATGRFESSRVECSNIPWRIP